ncbi:MAG: TIGR03960 family B12-binding radical SAM protein, partial [Sporomusaceae bacterium]|nr:TIGR03960 family B12-binding radical SAM protein [Sporomusaceae bacterium]
TFALAFPDIYEVGMSYLGYKILYHILNKRSDTAAERVYAPWVDMEQEMRQREIPLFSHETFTPLYEFDLLGFTLQYEMSYTNILNMLDLGRIPLRSEARTLEHPFVVGGGPCVYNPEPLAPFFDFFIIGEGEEVIEEVVAVYKEWKLAGKQGGRLGFLRLVSKLAGIYVPSFYEVTYLADGRVDAINVIEKNAPTTIAKRVVCDLESIDYPTKPVVPYTEIVHDRVMLELFRGCTRGCRFCQAGTIYRPVRERKLETLVRLAKEQIASTGYNEISLTSLSSADYSQLPALIEILTKDLKEDKVSVSLPSLRLDSFSIELAKKVQQVRKSGLTFAPEAGTQRLRDVINKGVTEENLMEAVGAAFRSGWTSVKLYFMIGLPTETDEDIKGIADLAYKVVRLYQTIKGRRGAKVTVSVSSFVPKSQTPFQWFGQNTLEEIQRKQQLLRSFIKDRSITYNYHEGPVSMLEGVFARGDRRLGEVLYQAWQGGAKFDSWSEQFRPQAWKDAFNECALDPDFYNHRTREADEVLPWDILSPGVHKDFLLAEYSKACAETLTVDCRRELCGVCGVCQDLKVNVIDWSDEK